MAKPAAQAVADRYTRRQLALIRFANGLSAANDADLRGLGRRLRALLATVDADFTRRQLPGLLREAENLIRGTFHTIADRQLGQLGQLGAIEAAFAANAGVAEQQATAAAVARSLDRLLVQGVSIADQWQRQGTDLSWRVTSAVREALLNGTQDTLASVIGTGAALRGGLLEFAMRNSTSLTDTAVSTAAYAARLETFKASDVDALEWHSILDNKTTPGCAIRAGLLYTLELAPIGHKVPIERPPPRHWNCRSILLPVKYPDGVPDSGRGPGETFAEWMDRHSPQEQDAMFGAGRAQLWRDGTITLSDLVNQRGQVLTLAELRA